LSSKRGLPTQAIVYQRYGPPSVLQLAEIARPKPADNQVLIRVRAASVNPLDWHFLRGMPYGIRFMTGLRQPKDQQLGADVAGEVEAVGSQVTQFKPGDAVFGMGRGAFAEYTCAPESALAQNPANVTFEQAASVPIAAFTALQGLRDHGHLQPGQRALINGAAGGVGTFAVQFARVLGGDATGVCSTRNVDMVRTLGANQVVDYTQADFTQSSERYDILLDCIGNHPLQACRRVLNPKGIYIGVGAPSGKWVAPMDRAFTARILNRFVSQRLQFMLAKSSQLDLILIAEWMATGKVTPAIDRTYKLSEVPDAIRYLEEGHARGKVVITV
jgi:NADPH:quinone reductase-like Zn-dependent oxidoreductase